MGATLSGRVIDLPREIERLDVLASPSFTYAYQLDLAHPSVAPAEQWARAVFEGAPSPLWWFMVFGWRAELGLRLAPSKDPGFIRGWTVESSTPTTAVLSTHGRWFQARLVVLVEDDRVVHATLVRNLAPLARVLWLPADPIHHRVIPYLMQRAAASLAG